MIAIDQPSCMRMIPLSRPEFVLSRDMEVSRNTPSEIFAQDITGCGDHDFTGLMPAIISLPKWMAAVPRGATPPTSLSASSRNLTWSPTRKHSHDRPVQDNRRVRQRAGLAIKTNLSESLSSNLMAFYPFY